MPIRSFRAVRLVRHAFVTGEHDLERRSTLRPVRDAHVAAVTLDDRSHDGKPETAAGWDSGTGARRISLVEPVEHIGQVLRRDAGPGVFNRDADAIAVALRAQYERSAVRHVPDGIRGEVLERLFEPLRVPPNFFGVRRDVDGDPYLILLDRRLMPIDD